MRAFFFAVALVAGSVFFTGCDLTSTPIDHDNLDPGVVAGTYEGSAEIIDQQAALFTVVLAPAEAATSSTTAASSTGDLAVSGTLLHNSIAYEIAGSGQFTYPAVALSAKARDFEAVPGFTFDLTTDASGVILQGTVNGNVVRLIRQN
jgi:hypothetical protein